MIRPARLEDAAAVAALVASSWPDPYPDWMITKEWTSPVIDLERDTRVATDAAGAIVGYGGVEDLEARGERFWLFVTGETDELLPWALGRIGSGRVLSTVWSENRRDTEVLERAGFALVRHMWRMGIDLEGPAEAPVWPEGIAVRTFREGDGPVVHAAHMETFRDHWEHIDSQYDEWTHWLLDRKDFDPTLWFIAEEAGELAGFSLCRQDFSDPEVGWVSILGVRRPWRRRGLGRALLLHSFAAFRDRDYRSVVLGVDAESLTGANRLYESAGMSIVHRFDSYEKVLEPE